MTDPARNSGRLRTRAAFFLLVPFLCAALLPAQDDPRPARRIRRAPPEQSQENSGEKAAEQAGGTVDPDAAPAGDAEQPTPAKKPEPVVAVKVGHLHTISGAEIENGVIVIQGERIESVGARDSVVIPEGATVLDLPQAHAYPGLVDALSQAFAPRGGDGIGDAGGELGLALDLDDDASRELVRSGVTTSYVSSRSGSLWRGKGALLHFGADGPARFPGVAEVGVHLRLAVGDAPMHPLARMEQLAALGREFEQLEAYEKTFTERQKKLEEYEKKFGEYLDWHRKKSGTKEATPAPAESAAPADAGGGARPDNGGRNGRGRFPRGEGGGRPGGGPPQPGGNPAPGGQPATPANPPAAPDQNKPAEGAAPKPEEKAPERPTYPTAPQRDPAKDALIAVRDGKLALFVEVDREEEVERALAIARDYGVKRLVLELATRAGDAVDAIAEAGIPVLVQGAEPPPPPADGSEEDDVVAIAVVLARRGVPIAIGSASVARARNLSAIAAEAVGQGVPADVALRAITLDAANLLGVGRDCGSLEAGKLGDVLITSGPLLQSDTRVLRVLSSGRTAYEVK